MIDDVKPSLYDRVRRVIIGGERDLSDPEMMHKMSLIPFFAWVGLGADGLSSACYGPAEAFEVLHDHPYLAIFVALATAVTVTCMSMVYTQIVQLFPSGGGGYMVATKLLNPFLGMISGCALVIDYILTISLSIASGVDAVFSFLPEHWAHYRIYAAVIGVLALTALNVRGVKESIVFLLPIFLLFVALHLFAIVYTLATHVPDLGGVVAKTNVDFHNAAGTEGGWAVIILLLTAYSMGAGTYTGIEAVSTGMPLLREPRAKTGRRTMVYMAVSLIVAAVGLMLAYIVCEVHQSAGKTLNAVLFETITGSWNPQVANTFVYVILLSEAAILFVAAQAGFIGGPRVLANMALDRWFPNRFATLSDRLVTHNGIVLMGGTALAILIFAGASVKYLLVLYSISVFITFVLAALGMVRHWWHERAAGRTYVYGLGVAAIGLAMTAFILISMIAIKFREGGWITLVVTAALVGFALLIKNHYRHTRKMLKRLDSLVAIAQIEDESNLRHVQPVYEPNEKTAVVLVNGFNGLGLHTVFSIIRLFGGTFKNYAFVYVSVVDAGNFVGHEEIERLNHQANEQLDKYVDFMKKKGIYAEGSTSMGTDIVQEITELAPQILQRFPNAVFFGGQITFGEETFLSRLLHNYIVFAVQRRLYSRGVPFVILPIRA